MWVPQFALNWWKKYQEDEYFRELYARLDRNGEGRYNHKQHLKDLEAQKKAIQKKNREAQKDRKG